MKFKAKEVFADYDENKVLIIAFSGVVTKNNEPVYFMIQDSIEYDEQDIGLGLNKYYIEKNNQSMSGYGGLKKLTLARNSIQIELDQVGIENLKETNIEIEFECNSVKFENLENRLERIFSKGELKKIA